MGDDHFYLGIDLGTTNSVICWGRYRRRLGLFEPSVLEVEHLGAGRKSVRSKLLPSVVYFQESGPPIVGELARTDAYRTQPQLVARSVKSYMGTGQMVQVGNRTYTPAYVSHLILNQLRAATKAKFGVEMDDVVITVPASFDADMRADTLEAARQAGFKVREGNGAPRDMLLDEPRAALHYLIYQQQMDEIPSVLIDFSTPKTVLIFDLGGGTLDVSLHKVEADYDSLDIDVEDIAISRYTRIGGDDFDELITGLFQQEFEAKYGIQVDGIPEDYIRHAIKSRLLLEAEAKKREINDQFAEGMKHGATLDQLTPRISVDVQVPNLYDNKGYWSKLGWDRLAEIIAPLMGNDLSIEDVARFDELGIEQAQNIVFPVLDVLHKAEARLGKIPDIDAVFLNGGMTRFLPVQMRLERLLGQEPKRLLDPDLSVALGASLYHYALHQGIRPKTVILAETIGIELAGGYVKHLVPAGTVLPMPSPQPLAGLIVPEGTSQLTIPFYRGERKDTTFPNTKLLERVIELPHAFSRDEPLEADVFVDGNKTLTFRGRLETDRSVEIEIRVQSSSQLPAEVLGRPPKPAPAPPAGPALDVDTAIDQLISNRAQTEGAIKAGIEARILEASNRETFIRPLAEKIRDTTANELLRRKIPYRRAMFILGVLGGKYPDLEETGAALSALIDVSASRPSTNRGAYINQIVAFSTVAMGRLQSPGAETALLDILYDSEAAGAHQMALVALAKVSRSANAVAAASQFVSHRRVGTRMNAAWSLGKMGSRENVPPMPISPLSPAVDQLLIQIKREQSPSALKMIVYALGEICDQRHADRQEVVGDKVARDALVAMEAVRKAVDGQSKLTQVKRDLKRNLEIAQTMVRGELLAEEQERVLLKLRSMLDESEK